MKHYKKVTKLVEEVSLVECDRCGQEARPKSNYDAYQFEFCITRGEYSPPDVLTNETTMDLCNTCARELETLLALNGYKTASTFGQ